MLRIFALVIFLLLAGCKQEASLVGKQAYDLTEEIVAFGPRTAGGANIQKVRNWIEQKIASFNLVLQKRSFMAKTPKGFVSMINLSYIIPGTKHDEHVVLLAHYDSKIFNDRDFVGANDAASSVALLIALTPQIQKMQLPYDVQVVFVDGEEAFVVWTSKDSLYGSRQMAQDIRGVKVKNMIVVDMIGDKNLSFIRSRGSDPKLLTLMEQSLQEMNQTSKLETSWCYVTDDHTPFVEMGIPTLHLMDFTFGGNEQPGTLWHTEKDNMDSISAESLATTGEVIIRILKKIT